MIETKSDSSVLGPDLEPRQENIQIGSQIGAGVAHGQKKGPVTARRTGEGRRSVPQTLDSPCLHQSPASLSVSEKWMRMKRKEDDGGKERRVSEQKNCFIYVEAPVHLLHVTGEVTRE